MSESNQEADIAETLRKMEEMIGEKPVPQLLMSKVVPEWIPRQMDERLFVMQLPNIPEKYKHLIMIAVAAAVGSKMCTEVFTKIAKKRGVTEREIGEAILIARFALASTIFATVTPALEWLVGGDVE